MERHQLFAEKASEASQSNWELACQRFQNQRGQFRRGEEPKQVTWQMCGHVTWGYGEHPSKNQPQVDEVATEVFILIPNFQLLTPEPKAPIHKTCESSTSKSLACNTFGISFQGATAAAWTKEERKISAPFEDP